MGYQKFIAVGNVTRDVEVIKDAVAKFSLAVNGYKESVTFFNCTGFSKRLGEKGFSLLSEVKKGSQLLVEGEFQQGSYEKDGKTIKTMDLVVSSFKFVGPKKDGSTPAKAEKSEDSSSESDGDDSIPF